MWYWSRSRIADLLGPQPLRVTRFVPESLLTGRPPEEDRAELLALARGYEGRAWEQGRLTASRWWLTPPSESEWGTFLRGAGMPAAGTAQAVDAPIGATPWAHRTRSVGVAFDDAATWVRRGAVALGLLACVAIGFEAGAGLRGVTDVWATQRAQQQLDEPLQKILEARADAAGQADELQRLLALHPPRGQLQLLAEVQRIMPAQGWRIVLWNQPAIDRLEVTFAMDEIDATSLVSAWEASPMFTDVSSGIEEANKRFTLKARVVHAAAAGTGRAAAGKDSAATSGTGS